jgi:hypothetical protein
MSNLNLPRPIHRNRLLYYLDIYKKVHRKGCRSLLYFRAIKTLSEIQQLLKYI